MTEPEPTDAKNRALRTLVQNLVLDCVVAIAVALQPIISAVTGWDGLDPKLITFTIVKTIVLTLLSYITRAKLDPLGLTPSFLRPPDVQAAAATPVAQSITFFGLDGQGRLIALPSAQ